MRLCGRENELAELLDRWQRVAPDSQSGPQIVVVAGERGIGKTRLISEFYAALSAMQPKDTAYWPTRLEDPQHGIDINPSHDSCHFNHDVPWLWWGLRAANPDQENRVRMEALTSYDRYLAPHLITLSLYGDQLKRGKKLAKMWAKFARDQALNLAGLDLLYSVAENSYKSISLIRGSNPSKRDPVTAGDNVAENERMDAVIEDLSSIFDPSRRTFCGKPGVIMLDDAQFAHADPSLSRFMERLLHKAFNRRWPVLFLVTHWRREFSPRWEASSAESFAELYRRANGDAKSSPSDNADKFEYGYIPKGQSLEIYLNPVQNLGPALAEALSGLTKLQRQALLDQAGGNPRHLEQIILYLQDNKQYFEDWDPAAALRDECLPEVLTATQDIQSVVMKRLIEAPDEVQEALGLASLQGLRFVPELAIELGQDLFHEDRSEGLRLGMDPFCMVSVNINGTSNIAHFNESLFLKAAAQRRGALKILGGEAQLQGKSREKLLEKLNNFDNFFTNDIDVRATFLDHSVRTLKDIDPPNTLLALAYLCRLESDRYSNSAALYSAVEFVQIAQAHPALIPLQKFDDLVLILHILVNNSQIELADVIMQPLLRKSLDDRSEPVGPHRAGEIATVFELAAMILYLCGATEQAQGYISEALAYRVALCEGVPSVANYMINIRLILKSAALLKQARQFKLASDAITQALSFLRAIQDNLPTPEGIALLASALEQQSKLAGKGLDLDLQRDAAEEAVICRFEIFQKHPNVETMELLANALMVASEANLLGCRERSIDFAQQAVALMRAALDEGATPIKRMRLSGALLALGDAQVARSGSLQQQEQIMSCYNEAIDVAKGVCSEVPLNAHWHDLCAAYEKVLFYYEYAKVTNDVTIADQANHAASKLEEPLRTGFTQLFQRFRTLARS